MGFTKQLRRRYVEEGLMATMEERISHLETKSEQFSGLVGELRGMVMSVDQKITSLDQKVEKMDRRLGALDDKWDRHFDGLDHKFTKMFLAVIGIQITTLLAIVAGLFSMVSKLLPQYGQ